MIVALNGVRLFTRRVGAGPLVVVLHGGPGAHHDYLLPQYDRLAPGRELFYYDQRGGGRSPIARETPVGWPEHVADLVELPVGHCPHVEATDDFVRGLDAFLPRR